MELDAIRYIDPSTMKSTSDDTVVPTHVVTRIAGEDIRPGDFVTTLTEVIELPSFLWCCDSTIPRDDLVRLNYLPSEAGMPFKVIVICLPFVFTKRVNGKLMTLDIRKHQIVKLDNASAKKVWKLMRRNGR